MKTNLSGVWLAAVFCCSVIWPGVVFADDTPKGSQRDIYDESANGAQQISEAVALAKNGNKNVFLLFGANWCAPCRKLHAFLESESAASDALKSNYIAVPIELTKPHNEDLPPRYAAENGYGLPFIVILGADGIYLTTKNTEELWDGDQISPEKSAGVFNGVGAQNETPTRSSIG